MPEDSDKIKRNIEKDNANRQHEDKQTNDVLKSDEAIANRIQKARESKVTGFKLSLDLDENNTTKQNDESSNQPSEEEKNGESETAYQQINTEHNSKQIEQSRENKQIAGQAQRASVVEADQSKLNHKNEKKKSTQAHWGCAHGAIYGSVVLIVSILMAFLVIAFGLDMTGLNKSDVKVPVTVTEEQCKNTSTVAKILKEAGVIDHTLFFQLYCKIKNYDGKFKAQEELALSPDMGYGTVTTLLQNEEREIVKLTFQEGSTIEEIAKKLEVNKVCSVPDFYEALESDKYTYEFLNEIPMDETYQNRFNKLEGYIFPDTYEFYVDSPGEAVVKKFLDNFNSRIDVTMRTAMKAKGMTLNDTIILASIIQWEANDRESMEGVSCVLHNRLNKPEEYPRLECDSTRRYINSINPPVNGQNVENLDYDTYERTGLPVGAINNPGLDAINAAMNPASSGDAKGCYFFATDMKSGKTYYSKTFKQHEAICNKYDIGMYADNK